MIDKEQIKKDQEEVQGGRDITYWKAKEGKNVIRILRGPDDVLPYRKVYTHFRVGPSQATLTCLKTFNKRCPLCEEAARLIQEGREEEGRALKPRTRYLFNIIDYSEPDKVQIMTCGPSIFNTLATYLIDWGDFSDPDTGYNITIERHGQGLETRYTVIGDKKNTPLKRKELLEQLIDLDSLIVERDPEEMLAILRGEDIDEEESVSENIEDKVKKELTGEDKEKEEERKIMEEKERKYECFGKKYDPNDIECQQCPERENCARVFYALKQD